MHPFCLHRITQSVSCIRLPACFLRAFVFLNHKLADFAKSGARLMTFCSDEGKQKRACSGSGIWQAQVGKWKDVQKLQFLFPISTPHVPNSLLFIRDVPLCVSCTTWNPMPGPLDKGTRSWNICSHFYIPFGSFSSFWHCIYPVSWSLGYHPTLFFFSWSWCSSRFILYKLPGVSKSNLSLPKSLHYNIQKLINATINSDQYISILSMQLNPATY